MGTPLRGRSALVKKGTSTVANLGRWSLDVTLDELDATVFTTTAWKKSMTGMQAYRVTIEGFYDPTDTAGQEAINTAMLAGTKLTDINLYVDDTHYWAPDTGTDADAGMYCSGWTVDVPAPDLEKITYTFVGYGPIAYT